MGTLIEDRDWILVANNRTTQTTWLIQTGLSDTERMLRAVMGLGYAGVSFTSRPFSTDMPPKIEGLSIVYGTTRVVDMVATDENWQPGVFFDRELFSYTVTSAQWGELMLNSGATITTVADVLDSGVAARSTRLFVRPVDDLKTFAGQLFTPGELEHWHNSIVGTTDAVGLTNSTEIVCAPECVIDAEWRVFIAGAQAIASSQYRRGSMPFIRKGAPDAVLEFAQHVASLWSPASVFVLDVALSDGRMYVVESNGFNSCGLYGADENAIVESVTEIVESTA